MLEKEQSEYDRCTESNWKFDGIEDRKWNIGKLQNEEDIFANAENFDISKSSTILTNWRNVEKETAYTRNTWNVRISDLPI